MKRLYACRHKLMKRTNYSSNLFKILSFKFEISNGLCFFYVNPLFQLDLRQKISFQNYF